MELAAVAAILDGVLEGHNLPDFSTDTDSSRGWYCDRKSSNSSLEIVAGSGTMAATL